MIPKTHPRSQNLALDLRLKNGILGEDLGTSQKHTLDLGLKNGFLGEVLGTSHSVCVEAGTNSTGVQKWDFPKNTPWTSG